MGKRKVFRLVALVMMLVITFLLPANHLTTRETYAAAQNIKYIKQMKVFTKKDGKESDAQKWCDSQAENADEDENNDWYVIPGDLNEGAAGTLKSNIGVFLVYQTTVDVKEAIRDVAVMNEGGNYSVGAYEVLLSEQRDYYKDLVDDMKAMITEYRTNYENRVPTTVNAYNFLNTYIDDDSGERLGELLLTISDADLAELLLQANGQVVLVVQDQLAAACDTKKSTWLDRMESIGGYEKLRKKYIKAYNNNTSKADYALKKNNHEKALIIADSWNDINQHYDNAEKFLAKYGLDKMSEAEITKWINEQAEIAEESETINDFQTYMHNQEILAILGTYKYEDASLLEFFAQDISDVTGENIKKLYPLAECLSDGQLAGLSETVSLYTLLMSAVTSTVVDDNNAPKTVELNNNLTGEDAEVVEEIKDDINEGINEWKDVEPISIYDGVDRGVFEGGVAVTSIAENYKTGEGTTWADSFVESGQFSKAAIGLGAGALISAAGAIACSFAYKTLYNTVMKNSFENLKDMVLGAQIRNYGSSANSHLFADFWAYSSGGQTRVMSKFTRNVVSGKDWKFASELKDTLKNADSFTAIEREAYVNNVKKFREEVFDRGVADKVAGSSMAKFVNALKIGLAVFAILLAIADITMTIIALVKYYNRSHLEIPKYMVDLSYNENKESSFISYKGLMDTGGKKQGDLNGGGGKQWLAIYATTDADAGDPILAPEDDRHGIIVKKKDNTVPLGYSPLHLFGKPNAAQNLTFADGEAGWSFNDKEGGIYLFFERDANWNIDEDASGAGTTLSTGRAILFGGGGLLLGLMLGIFGTYIFEKVIKKKEIKL